MTLMVSDSVVVQIRHVIMSTVRTQTAS